MSVTFDRALLIRGAKRALNEHAKAQTLHAAAVVQFRADHADKHAQETRAHAVALRDALTRALKRPGPIHYKTASQALGAVNLRDHLYCPPDDYAINRAVTTPKGLLTPAEAAETRALLAVLEAATGDVITANELKLLGLKNLQPIFTAAATHGVTAS